MASPMAGRPEYLRIADALREQIRDGTYPPGAKLPSERDLRSEYHVGSAGTVRAALAQLRDEGLVMPYQGRGVFVREQTVRRKIGSDQSWRDIVRRSGKGDAAKVTVRIEPCPPDIAEQLGIPTGELLTVRDRLLRIEGEPPDMISLSWHPRWTVDLLPSLADETQGGMVRAFFGVGIQRLRMRDVFNSRRPTDEERRRLELGPADVVTVQRGVTYDQDDRPLYAILHVAAGHRIEFGAYQDMTPTS